MSDPASTSAPWPAPHPVIDAPYGPRYEAPPGLPVPVPRGIRAGWDLTPIEPTPRSTRWLLLFTAICLLFAAVGGVVAYRFVTDGTNPTSWDPKVVGLVKFVEQETGLTFVHPVRIRYLTDADFNKLISKPASSLTNAERTAQSNEEAVGRAFGWYTGSTNVLDERNTLNTAGVLALYNFGSREIVARTPDPKAVTLTVPLRVTLTHELVHAMQDQRLDIRKIQARITDSEGQLAFTSLIEGHATFIEGHYINSLSDADQRAFSDYVNSTTGPVQQQTKNIARVLSTNLESPYVIGPALVAAAAVTKGGVGQLFIRPPVAQDQVLDPRAYFSNDQPEKTATPVVAGAKLPGDTVGIVRLYLTLAAAMSPQDAWTAASGWGNDVYAAATSNKGGPVCLSWNVYADNDTAAKRLHAALDVWAATRVKEARVHVGATLSPINVTMCDPGVVTLQALVGDPAITFMYTRANILHALIEKAANLDVAECATDRLMRTETLAALGDPDDALRARVASTILACSPK